MKQETNINWFKLAKEEDQYTDAVKAGDWPKAADLVRRKAMESGYGIGPVHHGSPTSGFNQFKIPSRGFNSNVFGSYETGRNAAFFTPDESAASGYQTQGGTESGETRAFYLGGNHVDLRNGIGYSLMESLGDSGVNTRWMMQKDEMWELFDSDEDPEAVFVQGLKSMGYDGAIIRDTDGAGGFDSYAVFTPNLIKSADHATYDDAGNVIPLNKRFDMSNNDVRY